MKNKIIFTIIVAVVFISAMYIYKDTLTLTEIILAFVSASGTIGTVWNWLSKETITIKYSELENKIKKIETKTNLKQESDK